MGQPETEQLVVRAVRDNDELRLANDLMAKGARYDAKRLRHWLEEAGTGYPGYEREHTRLAVREGKLVGALRLFSETARVGEARLRVGGLGFLAAAPDGGGDSVTAALLVNSLHYLRTHDYQLALTFAVSSTYRRQGFSVVFPDYSIAMEAVDAACLLPEPYRVRTAKPGDIPILQRLHGANDAGVACSLLRTQAHIRNRWNEWQDAAVLTDTQGKVMAYYVVKPSSEGFLVDEVAADSEDSCRCTLAAIAQAAARAGYSRLRIVAPPGHAFARFLRQYPSVHQMHVMRSGGAAVALVSAAETLEGLIPEWESLIARHAVRESRAKFTLVVEGRSYRVRANRGAVDVAAQAGQNKLSLTLYELTALVVGAMGAEEVLAQNPRLLRPEARELFYALFPKRVPFIWPRDRF
jgi:predicted acetyltransferase